MKQCNIHGTGDLDQSLQVVDIQKLHVKWMNEAEKICSGLPFNNIC